MGCASPHRLARPTEACCRLADVLARPRWSFEGDTVAARTSDMRLRWQPMPPAAKSCSAHGSGWSGLRGDGRSDVGAVTVSSTNFRRRFTSEIRAGRAQTSAERRPPRVRSGRRPAVLIRRRPARWAGQAIRSPQARPTPTAIDCIAAWAAGGELFESRHVRKPERAGCPWCLLYGDERGLAAERTPP